MNKKIASFIIAAIMSLSALSALSANADDAKVKGLQKTRQNENGEKQPTPAIKGIQKIYSKLSDLGETAEKDTAECIIDKDFTADTVSRSCTVKELSHDLTIDAGDNDIIVLLDNLILENTITVKAEKGSVSFFIQGNLECGGKSRGIVWHEICDGFLIDDKKYIPIDYYGETDSTIILKDNTVICGSMVLFQCYLRSTSRGAFTVEYLYEDGKSFEDVKPARPSIIGNAIFNSIDVSDSFETVYTANLRNMLQSEVKYGDSNNDGLLNMADAVAVMQSLANPDKYRLTEQGALNADVAGNNDGITNYDALAIQKHLLRLTDK